MLFAQFLPIMMVLLPLLIGFSVKLPKWAFRLVDRLLTWLVYVILWLIGMDLAKTAHLGDELSRIVVYTVWLFVLLMGCNAGVLMWYDRMWFRQHIFHPQRAQRSKMSVMGGLGQLLVLMLGVMVGKGVPQLVLPLARMEMGALMLLILMVGMQMRGHGIALRQVVLNRYGLCLSVLFVLSCVLAGLLFAAMLPEVSWAQGVALASGYGWYSLSGMMMTQSFGATWGSIALLNDLLRELVALVMIPVLMARFPNTAMGLGGATSLDFMLPTIQKAGGMATVPVAMSFGFMTNVLSPILMGVMSTLSVHH